MHSHHTTNSRLNVRVVELNISSGPNSLEVWQRRWWKMKHVKWRVKEEEIEDIMTSRKSYKVDIHEMVNLSVGR